MRGQAGQLFCLQRQAAVILGRKIGELEVMFVCITAAENESTVNQGVEK